MNKIPLAILGATGPVGQKMIAMLQNHNHFFVHELVASDRNLHKTYKDACLWREPLPLNTEIANKQLLSAHSITSPFALSALPKDEALAFEPELIQKGIHVISNASAFRMDPLVPLLIPEINPEQLNLIKKQKHKGKLITNPNCSTVFVASALKPLLSLVSFKHVSAITLQAASGAGYPGVPSLDLLGNTIPFIEGEEEKIATETCKILGQEIPLTVHVNRVPVLHGHSAILHIEFEQPVTASDCLTKFLEAEKQYPLLYQIHQAPNRPQPSLDLGPYEQRVHIGRIKQGATPHHVGLLALGHNLVRGAAGAAILNLELLHKALHELD